MATTGKWLPFSELSKAWELSRGCKAEHYPPSPTLDEARVIKRHVDDHEKLFLKENGEDIRNAPSWGAPLRLDKWQKPEVCPTNWTIRRRRLPEAA